MSLFVSSNLRIYRGLKSYDLAIADLQAAAVRDPENPDYPLTQASIAEDRCDTPAALELYLQAAKVRPQWAEVNLRWAGAPIELDRSSASGFICRADSFIHLGQVEMAIADLDQAMRLDPRGFSRRSQAFHAPEDRSGSFAIQVTPCRTKGSRLKTSRSRCAPQPLGSAFLSAA